MFVPPVTAWVTKAKPELLPDNCNVSTIVEPFFTTTWFEPLSVAEVAVIPLRKMMSSKPTPPIVSVKLAGAAEAQRGAWRR